MKRTRIRRQFELRPVSAKQRLRKLRWQGVKARALDRDDHICQRCGRRTETVHHKAGKATDHDRYSLDLLVSLCDGCHSHVHQNPSESYAAGWMVKRLRRVT